MSRFLFLFCKFWIFVFWRILLRLTGRKTRGQGMFPCKLRTVFFIGGKYCPVGICGSKCSACSHPASTLKGLAVLGTVSVFSYAGSTCFCNGNDGIKTKKLLGLPGVGNRNSFCLCFYELAGMIVADAGKKIKAYPKVSVMIMLIMCHISGFSD